MCAIIIKRPGHNSQDITNSGVVATGIERVARKIILPAAKRNKKVLI